jgi:hypothetical protein
VGTIPLLGNSPAGYFAKKAVGQYAARPAAKKLFDDQIKKSLAGATYYIGAVYQQNIQFDPVAGKVTVSTGFLPPKEFSLSDAYATLKSVAYLFLPDSAR